MTPDQPSRTQKIALAIVTAVASGLLVLEWAWVSYDQIETIPFSQFEKLVGEGNVAEVNVGSDTIQGKVKDKLPSGKSAFVTARVDAALAEKLEAKGVVGVGALGYTMQRPTEDRFLLSASELKNRIAVLMGGRASE